MHIENAPGVIFTYQDVRGTYGIFHDCTTNVEEFFGVSAAQIIKNAEDFFKMLGPVNSALFQQKTRQSFVFRQRVQWEFTLTHSAGERYFILQFIPKQIEEAFQGCGIILDITDLRTYQIQLEKKIKMIELMHDAMPDMFYYKDAHSRFLGGNRAWKNFHGITRMNEWIGKTDRDSPRFDPSGSEQRIAEEQELMRTGKTLREREIIADENNPTQFTESIKTPVYDENNQLVGLVGITRDITDQVNAEIDLENAKVAAEQAARAKSSFLAVMSHEIRTPMNGVIGCASLLEQTMINDDQQHLVHTIKSCGESLLVIINDILDYSKIESGQITLDLHKFHLRELIEDTFSVFAKSASDKAIELAYFIHPDVPDLVEGDSARIRQVLTNLLGNAVKFTERGEVVVECKANFLAPDEHICDLQFSVRDTGVGIAPENQAKLFSAFTQADSSVTRRFGGTGLGLVISKRIVEHMGGDIWLESEIDKGSCFYFSLSLTYDPVENNTNALPNIEELMGINAIIVDDNATNRKIISSTIMQWGMRATAFESPQVALENLQFGQVYDVAIFDFCMPDMNGDTLSKKMKALPQCKNTPIIILSSAADRILHKDENFVWLQKPARNSELAKAILKLVKGIYKPHATQTHTTHPVTEKNTRILVVDDNPVNIMVATKILNGLGYTHLDTASDGEAAVEKAKAEHWDVILMDLQMPKLDGFQAAQQIRDFANHPTLPWIIALTADVQSQVLERTLACGMNTHATKPIQPNTIAALLHSAEEHLSSIK